MEFVDRKLPFHAGDTTLIASDVIHTTYSTPGTSSKWSYIFVDIEEFFYPYFSLDLLNHSDLIQEVIHSYTCLSGDLCADDTYDPYSEAKEYQLQICNLRNTNGISDRRNEYL